MIKKTVPMYKKSIRHSFFVFGSGINAVNRSILNPIE